MNSDGILMARFARVFGLFLPLCFFVPFLKAQKDTGSAEGDSLHQNEPLISVSGSSLGGSSNEQDVPGLLRASGDIFVQKASYNFRAAGFRLRGYGGRNTRVMLNGMPISHPELGFTVWSWWGGLNDITRYSESRLGIGKNPYDFGSVGGYTNIDMRPSSQRAGTRVSYGSSNRSYRHRLMATHSSGMMENGWAYTVSASGRYSKEGYVPGTFFRGASYFLGLEKKLNEKHSLSFMGFGAPTVEGLSSISVQESYDLAGTNYYNPDWGYQDGKKRNSNIREAHQPILMLDHRWKIDEDTRFTSGVLYQFGKYSSSRLNWYDAKDPRPDYYRYRPSFYKKSDPSRYRSLKEKWKNNVSRRQLNWDRMYMANSKNLYTVENANGSGKPHTGMRSKYIVEDQHSDPQRFGADAQIRTALNQQWTLNGGADLLIYQSRNYQEVEDLLGGDFWVDVNQFAERDFSDPTAKQYDLSDPNGIVKEGEKFGYDYSMHVDRGKGFVQLSYKGDRLEGYLGSKLSHTRIQREGHKRNGLFPESSKGLSKALNFTNYGVKGGVVFKITGRHYLSANGQYGTRAPLARNAFLSPRTRDHVVPGLTDEKLISADLNYRIRYPKLKGRLSVYHTEERNKAWNRSFYHDEVQNFVNYTMTNVDHTYSGVELGLRYKIIPSLQITGAFNKGYYLWSSRPSATITQDNSSELLVKDRKAYLKNYRKGEIPQTVGSIGLKYNAPQHWFVGVDGNYFGDLYMPINPDRRTQAAVDNYVKADPQYQKLTGQEKLEPGYTIDMIGGKSWKVNGQYISLFVTVSNLLNRTDFKRGGYEQLRYDPGNVDRFPSNYDYMYGRTYFAMITYSF
ncbi:MAG: hypothetical protein ABEH38_04990 [Flavobacteriales bacterium]